MTTLQEDNSTEDINLGDGQARPKIHPSVRRLYEDPLCLDELGPLRQKPPIKSFKKAARAVIAIERMKQAASNSNHSNNAPKDVVTDVECPEEENTTRTIDDHTQAASNSNHSNNTPKEVVVDVEPVESPGEEEITTRSINDHNQRGRSMDSLPQEFCAETKQIELVPTFLPGTIYHLETVEESVRCAAAFGATIIMIKIIL